MSKKYIVIGSLVLGSLLMLGGTALADSRHNIGIFHPNPAIVGTATTIKGVVPKIEKEKKSFSGTVTAITGSVFTMLGKSKHNPVTYTVNTDTSTVFKKDGQTATLSDLAIGQKVMVKGIKDATTNTISSVTKVKINTHHKGK